MGGREAKEGSEFLFIFGPLLEEERMGEDIFLALVRIAFFFVCSCVVTECGIDVPGALPFLGSVNSECLVVS